MLFSRAVINRMGYKCEIGAFVILLRSLSLTAHSGLFERLDGFLRVTIEKSKFLAFQ